MNASTIIELENLRFGWKRGELLLDIEALSIETGSRVFLQGPSGCGKSSLLNLLGAVVRPDRGTVRVLGHQLESLSQAARDRFRADHIGFIFQQFNLIPYLDVMENVLLASRFSRLRRQRIAARHMSPESEASRLLSDLGMADAAVRGQRATELSVGQQQRVAAARALFGSPEIVIADEPTSSLDTRHRAAFLSLLDQECRRSGATLVFVSHDPSLAAGFERHIDLPGINRVKAKSDGVPR
jgi:putative ABC transport system ATP-binding protein